METIHAPQGRVPANLASLAPILPLSRPESKPDFSRGFGLDVTEEEEEPEEDEEEDEDAVAADLSQSLDEGDTEDAEVESRDDQDHDGGDADVDADMELDLDEVDEDGMSTVGQSRIHSRHVSKLSVALSLVSVGRAAESAAELAEEIEIIPSRSPVGEVEVDVDPAEEWTGSEDLDASEYEVRSSMTFFHFFASFIHNNLIFRASVNFQIPQMKKRQGKRGGSVACTRSPNDQVQIHHAAFPTSLSLLTQLRHILQVSTTTLFRTRAKKSTFTKSTCLNHSSAWTNESISSAQNPTSVATVVLFHLFPTPEDRPHNSLSMIPR